MIAEVEGFLAQLKPATEEEVARMVRKYLSYREQLLTKSTRDGISS